MQVKNVKLLVIIFVTICVTKCYSCFDIEAAHRWLSDVFNPIKCIPDEFLNETISNAVCLARIKSERRQILKASSIVCYDYANLYDTTISAEVKNYYRDGERALYLTKILSEKLLDCAVDGCQHYDFWKWLKNYYRCEPFDTSEICTSTLHNVRCNTHYKFRTITAHCTNLQYPRVSAAETAFERIISAKYDDDLSTIRKAEDKSELPNAREVMVKLADAYEVTIGATLSDRCKQANNLIYVFSQFVLHDIALTISVQTDENCDDKIQCCSPDKESVLDRYLSSRSCLAVEVPSDDCFYRSQNMKCIEYVRSTGVPLGKCRLGPLNQVNKQTHTLDCSQVYGSDVQTAKSLRCPKDGHMQLNFFNYLPLDTVYNTRPVTGDPRMGNYIPTTSIYTLFYYEHNRIVNDLKIICCKWSRERLYQEARRILIAEYQHIIYSEFLPMLLGEEYTKQRCLNCDPTAPECDCYSNNEKYLNPTALNEVVNCALKYFDIWVPRFTWINDKDTYMKKYCTKEIRENFYLYINKFCGIFQGLMYQPLENYGYSPDTLNAMNDIYTINLHRCRDHGIAGYTTYVKLCFKRTINNFSDLEFLISIENINTLKSIYKHVNDIDLLAGITLENIKPDSLVPPTLQCLLIKQAWHLKCRDRHFYTHGQFTKKQLNAIKKVTFAGLVCANKIKNLESAPKNFFKIPNYNNTETSCRLIPQLCLDSFACETN